MTQVDPSSLTPPSEVKVGPPLVAWVLLSALTISWGAMWPLLKIAVAEIPIFTLRGSMAVLAGIILFGVAFILGRALRPVPGEMKKILLCGVFTILIWFTLSALALIHLPAGRAALLAYTMPFFAFVIGVVFLGERLVFKRILGVLCSLAAIGVLGYSDILALVKDQQRLPLGLIVILGAALTWAVGSTLQTHFALKTPTTVLAAWMLVSAGLPLFLLGLSIEPQDWRESLSTSAVWAYIIVCLVSTAFGFWCWSMILKLTPLAFASIAVLSVPMTSQVLSFSLLGEPFGWREFLGLSFITLGLITILPLDGLRSYLFGNMR